ncbi:MAG: hypothetical protein ACYC4R_01665 [Anaerolineae bacterium]
MKARLFLAGFLLVLVALVLTGCEELGVLGTPTAAIPGAGTPVSTPVETPDLTPEVITTPEGTLTPDAEGTPERDLTPGAAGTPAAEAPETLDITALNTLDDQFDTYVVSSVVTFTSDTEGEVGFVVSTEVMTREGGFLGLATEKAQRSVITVTQDGDDVGSMEFVTSGDQTWTLQNGDWVETDVAPEQLLDQIGWVGNTEDMISEDAEGQFVGEETVNGIPSWHYRYGTEAFSDTERLQDLENAEADVWVSQEDQVIVRMLVRAAGRGPEDEMGTLEMESNLLSVDEPIEFALPPALEKGAEGTPEAEGTPQVDETPVVTGTRTARGTPEAAAGPMLLVERAVPWLDDASGIREGPNVVVYMTESTPEEVISFYEDRLADTDWDLEDRQTDANTARFTSEGEALYVVAIGGTSGGQTTVIVTVGDE